MRKKMEHEWVKAAFVALGLGEDVSFTEVRAAYIDKTTQKKFQRVILSDEHLEKDFVKYYKAYITLLKYYSDLETADDLSDYSQDDIGTFHFNQGLYHLINQNYIKAMEKFEHAYKTNKEDVLVLLYMGILLLKRKNYYAAEKYLLDAIKIDKGNDDAWFFLGENYLRAEEYRKALNMFETARGLNPTRKDLESKIEVVKEKLGRKYPGKEKKSLFDRISKKSGKGK